MSEIGCFNNTSPVYDLDQELALSKGIEPDGPDAALPSAIPGRWTDR